MKKILFVCAGNHFPQGAFHFLQSMQEHSPVSADGLFFPPADLKEMAAVSQVPVLGPYDRLRERERRTVDEHKVQFKTRCEQHGIRYHIHRNDEQWDKELLIRESRFADLILVSGELFCDDLSSHQPNAFLTEALHFAECPVFVVPENYEHCHHLYMAYDGSRESVFAIKQFAVLFPYLADLPAEVIYVKDESSELIPDLERLRHYTKGHFGSLNFSKLHFKAGSNFADWIEEKPYAMLISGSYGRSSLSYLTKRSFAGEVIARHKTPVFVAHL